MKKKMLIFGVAFLFLLIANAMAENYTLVFPIQAFRYHPTPKFTGLTGFQDKTIYKADAGSKLIKYDNIAKVEEQEYYLVQFTKVVGEGVDYVKKDLYYLLLKKDFDSYLENNILRQLAAVDIGVLVVPFKLRFGPTILAPNATIGPYLGYKRNLGFEWSVTFLGTFGLAGISLNDVNAKEPENALGFTYAGGVVLNYKGRFQIGLIGGADFIGGEKGKKWTYENKLWLALSTGFTFSK